MRSLIKDVITSHGIVISKFANWLGISRATFYNYCSEYDSSNFKSISKPIKSLFDFIKSDECNSNVDFIEYVWKNRSGLLKDPREFSLFVGKCVDDLKFQKIDESFNEKNKNDYSRLVNIYFDIMNHLEISISSARALELYSIGVQDYPDFYSKFNELKSILNTFYNCLISEEVDKCNLKSIESLSKSIKQSEADVDMLLSSGITNEDEFLKLISRINSFNYEGSDSVKRWFAAVIINNLSVEEFEVNFGVYDAFGEFDVRNQIESLYGLCKDYREQGVVLASIFGPYSSESEASKKSNYLEINYELAFDGSESLEEIAYWMEKRKKELQEENKYYI